ncbi:pentapeptide repeat-containing protein [Streptomyces sp. NPDC058430]|uniref:pentapeptide repeat-containing protein n=1 Tax=Streptomyces sp. NPDC058430 TaxID=3346495 RepID=UPI00366500B1
MAAAVFFTGWDLLEAESLKHERQVDYKTLSDLVKLSFGVVAGAAALVALVVAYRRQKVDEDGAQREATRLHTERFTAAVSQLGNEAAAVRLGGVHALAGLADDAPTRDLRQTCIDVLCAYLRMPYTAEADLPSGDADARHTYLALREVRHTIIRLIRDHLRDRSHPHSWQGHDLDFTAVVFDGGDFSRAGFVDSTVSFNSAVFASGTVNFNDTWCCRSTVDFSHTVFAGGTVNFGHASFSRSTVDFGHARFSGSTVTFDQAAFFPVAVGPFEERIHGNGVTFHDAVFSAGTVSFKTARFSHGTVGFGRAEFCGALVRFNWAEFTGVGSAQFVHAVFSRGTVTFDHAMFASAGTARFDEAEFTGADVVFRDARGVLPPGLVPWDGQPVPAGLSLPPAWNPPTS